MSDDGAPATVLLFPGQGAQVVGMGRALLAAGGAGARALREADEALGFALTRVMLDGPADRLARTTVAQPALVALGVAMARALAERGAPAPRALVGHSLGQYTALVVAGALDYADALRLVTRRGALMEAAVPAGAAAMLAVLGLDRDVVYAECAASGDVEVACHNAPGQTVVAGLVAPIERLADRCEALGATVAVIPTRVPSHCALQAATAEAFAPALAATPLGPPRIPMIDNVSARPLGDPAAIREGLLRHFTRPVLFEESLRHVSAARAVRFVECGPGDTLTKCARRTVAGCEAVAFEGMGVG